MLALIFVSGKKRLEPFNLLESLLCGGKASLLFGKNLRMGRSLHPVEDAPDVLCGGKIGVLTIHGEHAAGLEGLEVGLDGEGMEREVRGNVVDVANHLEFALDELGHIVRRRAEALAGIFADDLISSRLAVTDEAHVGVEVDLMGRIEYRVADTVDAEREAVNILIKSAIHIFTDARNLRSRKVAGTEIFAENVAFRTERKRTVFLHERVLREPRNEVRLRNLGLYLETMVAGGTHCATDDILVVLRV